MVVSTMKSLRFISFVYFLFGGPLASANGLGSGSVQLKEIPHGFYVVANKENISAKLLYALALQESQTKTNMGRVIAWKYALNDGVKGYFYRTSAELKRHIQVLISQGNYSFDVGIAQINYKWHSHHFKSIDEMIDPMKNLTYAAQYLKSHYKGDWWVAVGKYHSPNNKSLAKNYSEKVYKIWLSI